MSKSNPQPFFKFGRVFFPGEPTIAPDKILFQPLGNHVGNVRQLARKWQDDNFSLERVIEGINLHDKAKPQTFKICVETNKQGEFTKYTYSFKGHRFKVDEPQNLWVQALARGHHDYSTKEIIKDTYQLKKDTEYQKIFSKDPLQYAKELYILEMCDQIEAELVAFCSTRRPHVEAREDRMLTAILAARTRWVRRILLILLVTGLVTHI